MVESEYMGGGRAKIWTYLILAGVLVVGTVVGNLYFSNPELATKGVDAVAGMPSWAGPVAVASVGLLVYVAGLKMETDWPEGMGALMVAGSLAVGEVMVGWERFELGGLMVVPYAIPVAVFLAMMAYSVVASK